MRALLLLLLFLPLALPETASAAPAPAPAPVMAPVSMAPSPAPVAQRRGRSRRSVPQRRSGRGGSRGGGRSSSNFSSGPAIGDLSVFRTGTGKTTRRSLTDLSGGSFGGSRRPKREGPSDVVLPGEAELLAWFETGDGDSSGWISYRESAHSLGFDRSRYRRFDENRDGRMGLEEFELYVLFAKKERTFREPLPPADLLGAPTRTPEQLRNAYDRDRDGLLSRNEVEVALRDYGREDLVPERVVMGLDRDDDNRLNVRELSGLEGIVGLVSVDTTVPFVSGVIDTDANNAEELFGVVEPRAEGSNAPPRIQGPVRPFHRLDLDRSGGISLSELEELLRPLFSSVRVATVLHTLDVDLNGELSEQEFESAIGAQILTEAPSSGR